MQKEYSEFSILSEVIDAREKLRFERLPDLSKKLSPLYEATASFDADVSDKATSVLQKHWLLSLEKSSLRAESLDLQKMLAEFSEEQIVLLLKNIQGIQLTDGCNGGCYFCYGLAERGVNYKLSFSSVEWLLEKYGQYLPDSFIFYGDSSDPLDYQDGEHSYIDVYKLFRSIRPISADISKSYHEITTSIPKGSQLNFINLAKHIFYEQRASERCTVLRISISEHNVRRVEIVLMNLIDSLREDGVSDDEIEQFLFNFLHTSHRFSKKSGLPSDLTNLGQLIKKHDDFLEIESPACVDGIEISPTGVRARMMVAACIYEPSGLKSTELNSENLQNYAPKFLISHQYSKPNDRQVNSNIDSQQIMTPWPMRAGGAENVNFENQFENVCFLLGRDALILDNLMKFIYGAFGFSLFGGLQRMTIVKLYNVLPTEFDMKVKNIREHMDAATNISSESLSDEQRQKLSFYIKLNEFVLGKAEFLIGLIRERYRPDFIAALSLAMRQIGSKHLDQIEQVISSLILSTEDQSELESLAMRSKDIDETVLSRLRPFFNVDIIDDFGHRPRWIEDILRYYRLSEYEKKRYY